MKNFILLLCMLIAVMSMNDNTSTKKVQTIVEYKCQYNKFNNSMYNCKPASSNYRQPSSSK